MCLLFISCATGSDNLKEKAKLEIKQAENDFEKMAADKGIAEAFWFFADSDAIIKRQKDTLIAGKNNIRLYYSTPILKQPL